MRIGICCIAKDEDRYIEEWISYHQKLGVDEFFVYENGWRAPDSLRERFGIHFFPFDGDVMQVKSYNDCLHRTSVPFELDWLAFIDVDEFFCVLDQKRTFQEILSNYAALPSLAVNWRLFGDSGVKFDGKNFSVLERFVECEKVLNHHVKQIVNVKRMSEQGMLESVRFLNPHCLNTYEFNLYGHQMVGPFNEEKLDVPAIVELHHFFTKTYGEFVEKCKRGRADTTEKRDVDWDFSRHNKNEVRCTIARDFYREGTR